jgi:transposase
VSFLMVSGSSSDLYCLLRLGPVAYSPDDRGTINGILYVLVIGYRWTDMPHKYGSYKTC